MTTKEQERKALDKIRKIIEELGQDSYIATAFEGCIEDAENNIEDDAAYSMKSRWEHAEEKLEDARQQAEEKRQEVEVYKKELQNSEANINRLNDLLGRKEDERIQTINTSMEYWSGWQETKEKLTEAEQNIITLKAKLYDLITA